MKLPRVEGFVERAVKLGAVQAKMIDPSTIVTAPWVRLKCRFGCPEYGNTLCCPPHVPDYDETRKVLDSYELAILFEQTREETRLIASELEREVFLAGYYKAFGMTARSCHLCEDGCPLGDSCIHAEDARPTMEAFGIDVYRTVRANGFKVSVVKDLGEAAHFFGLVLVE